MNQLHVWLDGTHVADITRRTGRLTLAYNDSRRRLSLSLPTERDAHSDALVRRWIAGLLPDDDRVLDRWGRTLHVSADPFALLGTAVGLDCAGAVQFTSDGEQLPAARDSGGEWLDADDQERLVDDLHDDRTGWAQRTVGGLLRLHQEDMCQALGRMPTERYQNEGGPSPADIATLLRSNQLPTAAARDLRQFAEALLLNWLLAGTDAHAKKTTRCCCGPTPHGSRRCTTSRRSRRTTTCWVRSLR